MGVIVFVVQVGSEVLNNGTLMEIASYPHENNFLRVRDDLQVLSGEIMASIVEVSLTVRRARCVVDVATYTQAPRCLGSLWGISTGRFRFEGAWVSLQEKPEVRYVSSCFSA